MEFDQTYNFQLVLFLDRGSDVRDPVAASDVKDAVEQASSGRLGLKKLRAGTAIRINGVLREQVSVWENAVWRIECAGDRVDVHFEARRYSDLLDQPPCGAADFVAVASPVATAVARFLADGVSRTALALTAQTAPIGHTAASRRIARQFFNDDVFRAAEAGAIAESNARTNRTDNWPLDGRDVEVFRIEAASSSGLGEEATLLWQFDTSTVPAAGPIQPGEAQAFFQAAAEWIESRVQEVIA